MNKKILVLIAGFLLIGFNLYAADGDLVVKGNLGIGPVTPAYKLDIDVTDATAIRSEAIKNTDPWLNGAYFTLDVNSPDAGSNNLVILSKHNTIGSLSGIIRGASYNTSLSGSGAIDSAVGMQNQVWISTTGGPYNITNIRGNETVLTFNGYGTHTVENFYGITSYGTNAAGGSAAINGTNWRHAYYQDFPDFGGTIANMAGLWIDQQTTGTNNYGLVLNGDGAGSDIVFGSSQEAKIYSSGGELFVQDGASNVTQISPHDPETGQWIFYSKNVKTGKVVRIDMERLVRDMEKLTGKKYLVETFVDVK